RSPQNLGGRVFVGRGDSSPECITAAFRGIVAAMSGECAPTTIGGGERRVCGGARSLQRSFLHTCHLSTEPFLHTHGFSTGSSPFRVVSSGEGVAGILSKVSTR